MQYDVMCTKASKINKNVFTVGKIYHYNSEKNPRLVGNRPTDIFNHLCENPDIQKWDFSPSVVFVRVPKKGDKVIFRKDRERKYGCVPKDGEICTVSRDGVKWSSEPEASGYFLPAPPGSAREW